MQEPATPTPEKQNQDQNQDQDQEQEPWTKPGDPWWWEGFLNLIRAGKTINDAAYLTGINSSTFRDRKRHDTRFRRLYARARAEAYPRKISLWDEKLLAMADKGNLAALKLWASYHVPEHFGMSAGNLRKIEPDVQRLSIDGAGGSGIFDFMRKANESGFSAEPEKAPDDNESSNPNA